MFKKFTQSIEDGQLASYYMSLIVAKQGLPHTIGENKNTSNVLRSIPLSNNTVKKCIDEMSECVEQKLVRIISSNFDALCRKINIFLLFACV